MKCPICSGIGKFALEKNGYRILKCTVCNHSYTELEISIQEVQEVYSDNYFFGGKDGYPDYTSEKDLLIQRGGYYAKKIESFIEKGKVLDIGAAAGFILKGFINRGWKGTGVEPNLTMAEYGRNILGVDILQGSIETIVIDEEFDLVIMIQVVAHLFNINEAMQSIYKKLKPGGHLLIETWDKDSLTAKVFGPNWHEYSPPGTLNFFSKITLDNFAIKNGFSKVSTGRPKKIINGKHVKSLVQFKFDSTPKLKWIAKIAKLLPDKLAVYYPSEDLFWTLYTKINTQN